MLGYWIDVDPGPCLAIKPTQRATEDFVKERLRPLIDNSPSLARHKSPSPHDNTLSTVRLDSMSIYLGWAGSPQSLASRPCRYVLPDECDKFPPFSGNEADPMSLARERMATFLHRKFMFNASTPTTREGAIWKAFEGCGDRRRFHVPCPRCGEFQLLTWPAVKWPKLEIDDKIERADKIEQEKLAWYECEKCQQRIEEHHKFGMLDRGVWVSYDREDKPVQSVSSAGEMIGDRPKSKRVGFHLSSLYSPWRDWSSMAAEFIRAKDDVAATMAFRNSRLALPFEVQTSVRQPKEVRAKVVFARTLGIAGKARVAPKWSVYFLCTADVQKDRIYWQVDAWGYELRSKRLLIGVSSTFDEVYQAVFHPREAFVSEDGVPIAIQELIFDSRYRKDEITEFARRDPRRVMLASGQSTYGGPISELKVEKASGVLVWNINTMQSKDTLDRLIGDPDLSRWQVYDGILDPFFEQVTAEHKVLDPKTKQEQWKEKSSGAANHWWDCSAMSCAVAVARGAAMPAPISDRSQAPVNEAPLATFGGKSRY